MGVAWNTFKRFWTAEEVPRWFGLSMVVVYLLGLGTVAHFGIAGTRREANAILQQNGRYMVESLADRIDALEFRGVPHSLLRPAIQKELIRFTTQVPTKVVQIVDGRRRVHASSHPDDVGTVVARTAGGGRAPGRKEADDPARFMASADGKAPRQIVCIPLSTNVAQLQEEQKAAGATVGSTGQEEEPVVEDSDGTLFLEAEIVGQRATGSVFMTHADFLAVILVAFGVLFGLYRCLRAQLRGVSRIADRLRTHRADLEADLTALRIADTLDGVTSAWNELVDMTQHLLETARRNEANEELKAALERSSGGALSEALNAIPDGLIYISDEVRIEYVNTTACRLLGWNEQGAKRANLSEVEAQGPGIKILEELRASSDGNGSFEARTVIIGGDENDAGNGSTYRMWVIPLHRPHHDGECVVLIRDVSQQTRSDRAREDFVTQVTHELRTPLTNIRAYAETLSSGMFDDPKVVTECYNVITKETRRLSRLIEDILSVSQLEVGSIDLQLDQVDLKQLLTDGVRDVRGIADDKNIDLQLILPPKLEPIRADRDKLAVVVNNLLGNAIKYTKKGGEVIVGCQLTGESAVITFKDNGIGIAPEDHGRVFEKFQRAQDAETQHETGTGIGLYTAREIVRRHGGDIELISQKGEGATFLVRLPHRESRAISMSTAREA